MDSLQHCFLWEFTTASVTLTMKQDTSLKFSNKTVACTYYKMKAQGTLKDTCESILEYAKSNEELLVTTDFNIRFL